MSIATVSRVVNGVANKASPETVARVRRAIEELGYRPGSVGRALRRQESRLVAVLAANLANPAMAAIAASVEVALREAGLVMVLCDTHERPDLQDEYLLEMRAQLARAIVLLGAVESPQLHAFRREGEPLVFVNRRDPTGGSGSVPAPFVGIDNRVAGAAVARWVAGRGAQSVALVHAARTSSATADRIEGFRAELAALAPASRLTVGTGEGLDHLRIGRAAATDLVAAGFLEAPGPRAVVCLSDLIAFGVHRALVDAGVAVPRDVLVTGFDDSPLNDWIAPWLTSVRIPYESFGAAIVATLQGAPEAVPPETILPHRLVVR